MKWFLIGAAVTLMEPFIAAWVLTALAGGELSPLPGHEPFSLSNMFEPHLWFSSTFDNSCPIIVFSTEGISFPPLPPGGTCTGMLDYVLFYVMAVTFTTFTTIGVFSCYSARPDPTEPAGRIATVTRIKEKPHDL